MAKGKLFKKLHRWPGVILSFVLLYYGITGILLNHRQLLSKLDMPRTSLPAQYSYQHWGNSALRGNLNISPDSVLVYGNMGVWVTDSTYKAYRSLQKGFPKGADNRKVFDLHRDEKGNLYAATQFGLFGFDNEHQQWRRFHIKVDVERFVAIEMIDDSIYVLNRSYLFKGLSQGTDTEFKKVQLPPPSGYRDEVPLFETIWQMHSGEILGLPGKLFVDLLGLVTIFMAATGLIYFFFPDWIKRPKRKAKTAGNLVRINSWSLKWHNKVGAWFWIFLTFLFFTGIFLRPPLLIVIGYTNVSPIKYSHLDQPNPWYDKLRDIRYDETRSVFFLSTSDGMFFMSPPEMKPVRCRVQPPVSVMGINVFEPFKNGTWLVGSFSGLFLWSPDDPHIIDYPKGEIFKGAPSGRPVGQFKVTGLVHKPEGEQFMVTYDLGVLPLYHHNQFPDAPIEMVKQTRMSLWNLALEIHTGRFFQIFLGDFYILIVPLAGMAAVMVVISGYLIWRKRYKKRRY